MAEIILTKALLQCFMFSTLQWVSFQEVETKTGSYLYSKELKSKIEITHSVYVREENKRFDICKIKKEK